LIHLDDQKEKFVRCDQRSVTLILVMRLQQSVLRPPRDSQIMSETTRGVGNILHINDILWISVTAITPFAGYTRTIVKSLQSSARGALGNYHMYTLSCIRKAREHGLALGILQEVDSRLETP
jgi:hypothetical protein